MLGIELNGDQALLDRLYHLVDNPATDSIASWSQDGKSFFIWDPVEFSKNVTPTRQVLFLLPTILCVGGYEFRKLSENELSNVNFVRGQPQLINKIPRPSYFITKADWIEVSDALIKGNEDLFARLRKQEQQIKELK